MLKGEGKNILIYIVVLAIVFTTMYIIFSEKKIPLDANGFPLNPKIGDTYTKDKQEYIFTPNGWKPIIIGPPIDINARASFTPCDFDKTLDCTDPVIVVRPNRIGQTRCPDGSLSNPATGLCPPIINYKQLSLNSIPRNEFNKLSIRERQILNEFYTSINSLRVDSSNIDSKQSQIDAALANANNKFIAAKSEIRLSFNRSAFNNPTAKINCSCGTATAGTICNCWGIFNFYCHCRLKVDEKFFD